MIAIFLGVILLLTPFSLIFLFKNKLLGFLYIFTGLTVWHLFVALLSQSFHFFNYSLILTINVVVTFASLLFLAISWRKFNFRIKFNWFVLVAALIVIFELFSVHYLYSGISTDIIGHKAVSYQSYPYPYFADEWAGVAFTKYTINNQSLPIINPLWGNDEYDFPNIFVVFFSGLSELFLSLGLSPLSGYPIITILTGAIVCCLVFLFLKSAKTGTFFALIATLCLPWIITSVNLPGIWYLFPFIGGTIFLLTGLTALNLKSYNLAGVNGFLSLLIYPPFIVFIAPVLLYYLFINKKFKPKKLLITLSLLLALVVMAVLIILLVQPNNLSSLFDFFVKSFIRKSNEGCIPTRPLWLIIPVGLLPFALLGVVEAVRRKLFYFLVPLAIGLLYWSVYAYSIYFLIIDYARIAVLTSYFIIITIGLGLEFFYSWLANKYNLLKDKDLILALKIIILLMFGVLSFFYTQRSAWTKIVLRYDTVLGIWERPTNPPANEYLKADDLRLFADLKKQKFLAPSWKGLVIGAATGNYPLDGKASIISNYQFDYNLFMNTDCVSKIRMAQALNFDYLYSTSLNCDRFEYIGHSQEGFYLYKFQK
jgi:hypothetical protein